VEVGLADYAKVSAWHNTRAPMAAEERSKRDDALPEEGLQIEPSWRLRSIKVGDYG